MNIYERFEIVKIAKGLLIISCILFFVGCAIRKQKNYGLDFNTERIEKGIPIVEEHWDVSFPTDSFIIWHSNSSEIDTKARHIKKWIKIDNGNRIYEEDSFYKILNDSTTQQVKVRYTFNNPEMPWSFLNVLYSQKVIKMYGSKDQIIEDVKTPLSRDQAISILKEWKINLETD